MKKEKKQQKNSILITALSHSALLRGLCEVKRSKPTETQDILEFFEQFPPQESIQHVRQLGQSDSSKYLTVSIRPDEKLIWRTVLNLSWTTFLGRGKLSLPFSLTGHIDATLPVTCMLKILFVWGLGVGVQAARHPAASGCKHEATVSPTPFE